MRNSCLELREFSNLDLLTSSCPCWTSQLWVIVHCFHSFCGLDMTSLSLLSNELQLLVAMYMLNHKIPPDVITGFTVWREFIVPLVTLVTPCDPCEGCLCNTVETSSFKHSFLLICLYFLLLCMSSGRLLGWLHEDQLNFKFININNVLISILHNSVSKLICQSSLPDHLGGANLVFTSKISIHYHNLCTLATFSLGRSVLCSNLNHQHKLLHKHVLHSA